MQIKFKSELEYVTLLYRYTAANYEPIVTVVYF